jgi:peroxiredoxin Q/BCP
MPKLLLNQTAPNFVALDQNGQTHTLEQYQGSWVLLYFYPKDNTPGCTKEACSFRDAYVELKKKLVLLGVSADSQASHQKFAQKFSLPFPLLVDDKKKIIQAYGADGLIMPKRVSFLINPQGKIFKIYEKVAVSEHAQQILNDLSET